MPRYRRKLKRRPAPNWGFNRLPFPTRFSSVTAMPNLSLPWPSSPALWINSRPRSERFKKLKSMKSKNPSPPGQTGSSAMPHKRNPELCERVSGLARLIRGHSVTALENIALWHERDISHSSNERLILPDSCLALDYILNVFTSIMSGLQVFPKRMKKNLELDQRSGFFPEGHAGIN